MSGLFVYGKVACPFEDIPTEQKSLFLCLPFFTWGLSFSPSAKCPPPPTNLVPSHQTSVATVYPAANTCNSSCISKELLKGAKGSALSESNIIF